MQKIRISPSRRLTLTYVVLCIWIALVVFAILMNADIYALAVYFTSGLPLILGYFWSETARPSPILRQATEMVKNIGRRKSKVEPSTETEILPAETAEETYTTEIEK
jgi:hypothetical protein